MRIKSLVTLIAAIGLAVSCEAAFTGANAGAARPNRENKAGRLAGKADLGRDEAVVLSLAGLIQKYNRRLVLEEKVTLIQTVLEAAEEYQLDPLLVASVIAAESSFYPRARSRCGAEGLMQLTEPLQPWVGVTDPFDMRQNINGGCKYLHGLVKRFGRLDLVLAAYNAGPTRVARLGRIPEIKETVCYVRRVIGLRARLQAETTSILRGRGLGLDPDLPLLAVPDDGGGSLPAIKTQRPRPDRWMIASLVQEEKALNPRGSRIAHPPAFTGGKRRARWSDLSDSPQVSWEGKGGGHAGIAALSLVYARISQDRLAPGRSASARLVLAAGNRKEAAWFFNLNVRETPGEKEVFLPPGEFHALVKA